MSTFEIVKKLCQQRKISLAELENKLGFGKNSLYSWKNKTPNGESLKKVADYFNVSTDYLLGRDEPTKQNHNFTVEEALESVMSYDGKPLTDNDREVLRGIVEGYLNNKGNA